MRSEEVGASCVLKIGCKYTLEDDSWSCARGFDINEL